MLKSPQGTGGDPVGLDRMWDTYGKAGVFYALCHIQSQGASSECRCRSQHGLSAQVTGGEVTSVVRGSV